MPKFLIEGGIPLRGKIKVAGAKNAALPIIAATVLTKEESVINNVPRISDVEALIEILEKAGVKIKWLEEHKVQIDPSSLNISQLDSRLVKRLRASILLLGPLLARLGKVSMPHPGGCIIGRRPVGTHFMALEKLGAKITQDQENYHAEAEDLKGSEIFLGEASVTATENAMMAAVLAEGKTVIKFAACEPHVEDLAKFLTKMGAKIKGAGSHTVEIEGVKELHGTEHRLIPDQLEVGTFAIAAAITKGEVIVEDIGSGQLDSILAKLDDIGVNFKVEGEDLIVKSTKSFKPTTLKIDTWPGFPTDLQAPFTVLLTQANGTSLVHDWLYEGRLNYIEELVKMGANITVCDPHRAIVSGPTSLRGAKIISPDIRAGAALVVAALAAKGKSEIDNIQLVERGYEKLEERLKKLGAKIERIE
ncbi:UDP-N-acetylglucosamine 1-carboxyvinyltransferase [Patescibacteria group bacterium]|nr:MAG: UDP-N-acetylglucosamine 1-carboxyvinyltransferase [Patescibacteria group bacterium]